MRINSIPNKYYMQEQSTNDYVSLEKNTEKNLQSTVLSYKTISAKEEEKDNDLNNTADNGDEMRDGLIISASLRKQFESIRSFNISF
jgi:hypothetical protein